MHRLAWLLLVACSSSPPAANADRPQLNDLSILFPLDDNAALSDYLSASAVLPQAVFANDPHSASIAYDQLRVVGMRLDPCFGQIGPITEPAACKNQLRLVMQPLSIASGQLVADDSAVHAFYSLTRDDLLAAIGDVIAARVHASGGEDLGPLAPNVLLVRDGMHGELAKALESIVTSYASGDNLVRITSLVSAEAGGGAFSGPGDTSRFWELHGFDVSAGATSPITIATLPDASIDENIAADSSPLDAGMNPVTMSSDSIVLLANMGDAKVAPTATLQGSFDAALRIENPGFHSPDTIDCASCHLAQPARELVGAQLGLSADGDVNAFVADPSIPAADLRETTHVLGSDGALNIHAFSYRGSEAMINARVIHETAANLAYVATIYGAP